MPKFRFDSIKKSFYEYTGKLPIHGDAAAKTGLYRDRFELLLQRISRDPHFSKPAFDPDMTYSATKSTEVEDKALAVYLQSPGSPFVFCGAITIARPSAVLSLTWPQPGNGQLQITSSDSVPVSAKIGVSVEDLGSLQSLDVSAQRRIEHLAMKVGENLFNFMQSFCGVDGNRLVVPMDILDRWFKKFQEKATRDPEYLKGFVL